MICKIKVLKPYLRPFCIELPIKCVVICLPMSLTFRKHWHGFAQGKGSVTG